MAVHIANPWQVYRYTTDVSSFFNLSNLILIWYVTGPNFRYKCDGRGVHACELDGALGGDPSSEVLKCGGLRWSSLRWFQLVMVRTKKN